MLFRSRTSAHRGPRVVICDTRMGCGVPFLEARERNHFLAVADDEWAEALAVLDRTEPA